MAIIMPELWKSNTEFTARYTARLCEQTIQTGRETQGTQYFSSSTSNCSAINSYGTYCYCNPQNTNFWIVFPKERFFVGGQGSSTAGVSSWKLKRFLSSPIIKQCSWAELFMADSRLPYPRGVLRHRGNSFRNEANDFRLVVRGCTGSGKDPTEAQSWKQKFEQRRKIVFLSDCSVTGQIISSWNEHSVLIICVTR